MRRSSILSITIVAAVLSVAAFGQTKYDTYSNARFSYEIQYPAGVLIPQNEAENGDGRVFASKDKTAEMRVWGQYNAFSNTLKGSYLSDLKEHPEGITYKALLKNGYVISGLKGTKIFYQKTMLTGKDGDTAATFITLTIEYKAADKAMYDPIVKQVSKSFKFN